MAKIRNINSRNLYNDGAESKLLKIFKNAKDISSNSDELQAFIQDWPTEYHLSRQRLNLLLPLEIHPEMKILDVGGGTGILTRFLAEQGAQVTMLEGELERALVALERCRDLDNVEIVVGEVDDLDSDREFDLIVIVGVLEYIGNEKSSNWLKSLGALLKKDGMLAIAIENKLGLKYFLGYPEDHTGNLLDGILDYGGSDSPRTYSKKELSDLLSFAGFKNQEWWYPFPDYKTSTTVISENGLAHLNPSEISALIREGFRGAGQESLFNFNGKTPIQMAASAGILGELANSFFVLCRADAIFTKEPDENPLLVLGDLNWRKKNYRRKRILYKVNDKKVFINKYTHEVDLKKSGNNEIIGHNLILTEEYIEGESLETILQSKKISAEDVIGALYSIKEKVSKDHQLHKYTLKENPFLPRAECKLSTIWNPDIQVSNFIIDGESLVNIDVEWVNKNGVCLKLALLRSIFYLLINNNEIRRLFDENCKLTLWEIMVQIATHVDNADIHSHSREEFIQAEKWFISNVSVTGWGNSLNKVLRSKTPKTSIYTTTLNHHVFFRQVIGKYVPIGSRRKMNHLLINSRFYKSFIRLVREK